MRIFQVAKEVESFESCTIYQGADVSQVVIGSKHICWNRRRKIAIVFIVVGTAVLSQLRVPDKLNEHTDSRCRSSSLHMHIHSCSSGVARDESSSHREGM